MCVSFARMMVLTIIVSFFPTAAAVSVATACRTIVVYIAGIVIVIKAGVCRQCVAVVIANGVCVQNIIR